MKTSYLFPHRFKRISGIIFFLSFIFLASFYFFDQLANFEYKIKVFAVADGFLGDNQIFDWVENSVVDELLILLIITSGLIFAFSKEKHEDEMVAAIRLHSLAWATIVNYLILLLCYLFIYGMPFLNILMGAMFSQLVIFILLFRIKMYRFYNLQQNEE